MSKNKKKRQKEYIDSILSKGINPESSVQHTETRDIINNRSKLNPVSSTLFSRGKRSEYFFTEDSKLYITPKEYRLMQSGVSLDRDVYKWDSLSSRVVRRYRSYRPSKGDALYKKYEEIVQRYAELGEQFNSHSQGIFNFGKGSLVRAWNASIIVSIVIGMVSMSFIYKYLGQGASAGDLNQAAIAEQQYTEQIIAGMRKKEEVKENEWSEVSYKVSDNEHQINLWHTPNPLGKGYGYRASSIAMLLVIILTPIEIVTGLVLVFIIN